MSRNSHRQPSTVNRRLSRAIGLVCLVLMACGDFAHAAREPVLKQIALPHSYYFREMYLPQLTSGPSSLDFSPDGEELVYSMAGSLWRQKIGEDHAVEITHGPGYDYQPDWSPDGRHVVFVRHRRNAIELQRVDLRTLEIEQLTSTGAVNVEARYSPDGAQIAYVSTAGGGHFDLIVANLHAAGLTDARHVVAPRESAIARYYYSTHDHVINPSWTPDGERIVFVSNREVAYGTGGLCSVALPGGREPACFLSEETSWRANPQVAPDGRRVLYSSYHGRQWHQLWLTTLAGEAALPLTFGEFDVTQARWSPDGRRIAYISNEGGGTALYVQEIVGGRKVRIEARERRYRRRMHEVTLRVLDQQGRPVPARISVVGSDERGYAPDDAWVHADDGFDPARQLEETRYFHCNSPCVVRAPAGKTQVTAWRGHEHTPATVTLNVESALAATLTPRALDLPEWAPRAVTADMHVHMNYGGHYRHTLQTLAQQARAEDLDVVYNTIVNKEQRIPDIAQFSTKPARLGDVIIYQAQEHHTSYWGHLGLLHMEEQFVTPDFSAYQHSAFASPYPHNGAIADLAHAQNAVVGYVHPYDWRIEPEKEKALTHAFPVDVALGKVDYFEVVGFSDHKASAEVWHRLLNLGFRVPAGAGTDAMANYASLRGPVGMNRAYLHAVDDSPEALRAAVRGGRTVASNGPQLALQLIRASGKDDGVFNVGDVIRLPPGAHRVRFRAAMRSPAPVDHVELIHNGRVVASHRSGRNHLIADLEGVVTLRESGWLLLRAWSEDSHPMIFDAYPYATTSPIYVEVEGRPAESPGDAAYFVSWIDRVIDAARARTDYNDAREKRDTLAYLRAARHVFVQRAKNEELTQRTHSSHGEPEH